MKTLKKIKVALASQNVSNDVGPDDPEEDLWTSSITWELVRNADAGPTSPRSV